MKLISLLKKSSLLLVFIGMAAFSPARAQNTDSYTATGSGIITGDWDTGANWSTGAPPTSGQDAQFLNNYAASNGTVYTVSQSGTETVNSLWFNSANPPSDNSNYGWVFNDSIVVNGTDPVTGYNGFVWGVVDDNDGINDLNNVVFNNSLDGTSASSSTNAIILTNTQTAIAGNIEANIVATTPGTTLLVTNVPSNLGGQMQSSDGNEEFAQTTVTLNGGLANDLTNINLDITVNGDDGNQGGVVLPQMGPPQLAVANQNFSSTNVILAGGALLDDYYNTTTFGSLTLGVGTNILEGGYGGDPSLIFSGGLANGTPAGGTVLAINAANYNGSAGSHNNVQEYDTNVTVQIADKNTSDNVNGILGGWAIAYNTSGGYGDRYQYGADWATYDSSGDIIALTGEDTGHTGAGYTYDEGTVGLSDGGQNVTAANWTSVENIDLGTEALAPYSAGIDGTGISTAITVSDALAGDTTINSLRFGVASAASDAVADDIADAPSPTPPAQYYYLDSATLDVAGHQLVINSGGIMDSSAAPGVDTGVVSIIDSTNTGSGGSGSITAGSDSNYNLYIYTGAGGENGVSGQNGGGNGGVAPTMLITAPITDNDNSGTNPVSVTVSSTEGQSQYSYGNVYLYGNNTYTGNTYLVGGAATIDANSGLGLGGQVVFNGGSLYIAAPMTLNHQIVVDGGDGGVIYIEPIGTTTNGSDAAGDTPGSGLVLTNQNGGPAITGNGPLTIDNDKGVASDLYTASGENPGNQSIVEIAGSSTLTGPLVLANNTYGTTNLDVFLDNAATLSDGTENTSYIPGGYALNSDTYLNGNTGSVSLTWLASDQVNPTAVIDVNSTTIRGAIAEMQLSGYSDTIGGLIDTDTEGAAGLGIGFVESNGDAGDSTLTINTLFRPDVYEGVYDYDGTISGSGTAGSDNAGVVNIVKTGPAIEEFTGNNTYTGTTTVNAGTLLVNGTHTNGGNYFVNGGGDASSPTATLGGYGSIALASTSNSFTVSGTDSTHLGIIYPGPNGLAALTAGTNAGTPGTPAGTTDGEDPIGSGPQSGQNIDLTLGSQGSASVAPITTMVNFDAYSELKLDLGSNTESGLSNAGNGLNTQLYVYGAITINAGATLALNILPGSTIANGAVYVLAVTDAGYTPGVYTPLNDGDPLGTINGTFSSFVVTGGVLDYTLDYTTDPGELLLTVDSFSVPEPSVMAMMVGALGLLVFVLRRRKTASA